MRFKEVNKDDWTLKCLNLGNPQQKANTVDAIFTWCPNLIRNDRVEKQNRHVDPSQANRK